MNLLQASVFALVLSTMAPAWARQSEVHPGNDVARVLLAASDSKGAGERLAALGPERLPELFVALREGKIPVRLGERGHSVRELNVDQTGALLEAFGLLPRTHVIGHLRAMVIEQPCEQQDRVTALRILGSMGTSRDVGLLLELAAPTGGGIAPLDVRLAFERTLRGFLKRHPDALPGLAEVFPKAPLAFVPTLATVLAEAGPNGVRELSRLLGRLPEADALILIEIGRVGRLMRQPVDLDLCDAVRAYLRDEDPQLIVEAARVSEKLGDGGAVPYLIKRLDHPSENVRAQAERSLHALTDRRLGPRAERWAAWYEEEKRWWEQTAQAQFAVVRSGPGGDASHLILEMSKKRLFRHELALPLTESLRRSEVDLVVLGCAALGHLGSDLAVPALVECLKHSDKEVRTAAWRSLQRITGLELPPEAEAWGRLLVLR